MRVEPPLLPGHFPSPGPSSNAAAQAALFAQLAALAPTAAEGAAPPGDPKQLQINTYWLFRALSDFTMLALTQSGHYSSTAYQPYLNDLQYLLNQSPPLSLDPSIMTDLKNYTGGSNYTKVPANLTTILNDFTTILQGKGSNPGNYNFKSFNQDQMMYFCTFQMAFALLEGSDLNSFWKDPNTGTTSALATTMGELITTYFYERNLNSDGTENAAGLKADLTAFMAQFQPMIDAYGSGFQTDFPDMYNMLNGGIDIGKTPYAGLLKDITTIESGTWPFSSSSNLPPKIPLGTPPPPWGNPSAASPPVFNYPTPDKDPGVMFFSFVSGFFNQLFKS